MTRTAARHGVLLSGGSVFDGLDYSFTPGHEDGTDLEPNGPGGGSPALRSQLRVLQNFLQSLSLVDLQLDTHTVKGTLRGQSQKCCPILGKSMRFILTGMVRAK